MSEMSDANNDKIVVVPQRNNLPSPLTPRSRSPSPPPPDTDPAPPPAATPAVAAAIRPSRGLAAGDDAFPSIVADDENDENELPPSYEISTLPRPSDAHVHITVRSNTSASSLPSLTAGPGSINTQGYVLTAPMSHQTASSRHSGSHSHHEHNDQDPITFYGVEDPWKTGAASPTAMDAAFPSAAASAVPTVEGAAAAITKVFASRTMEAGSARFTEAGSALPKQGTAVLSQCRQQQRHGRRGCR